MVFLISFGNFKNPQTYLNLSIMPPVNTYHSRIISDCPSSNECNNCELFLAFTLSPHTKLIASLEGPCIY